MWLTNHGNAFKNVSEVLEDAININEWLLVSFPTETRKASSSSSLRFYLYQVVNKTDNVIFGKFLRKKQSSDKRRDIAVSVPACRGKSGVSHKIFTRLFEVFCKLL